MHDKFKLELLFKVKKVSLMIPWKKIYSVLLFLLWIFILSGNVAAKDNPYVILVSFDGFRWDYVNRGITPNLKRMEREGASALSLRPTFPSKTFPNHYSIISGMYPENHGIIFNRFTNPFTGERYKVGDTLSVRDSKWYLGEAMWETAERQGIRTACYFWPGSEVHLSYRRPTYVEYYDHDRPYEERVDGIIRWLLLPESRRPHFLTLYFDATDTYGHKYGPDSPQINEAIQRLDSILGLLITRLENINFLDKVNIIVVSDHGMTPVSKDRVINVEEMLNGIPAKIQWNGPVMMIEPANGYFEKVLNHLTQQADHFRVYQRNQVPGFYHFSHHPFISRLILVADPGWSLVDNTTLRKLEKYGFGGNHGYDNNHLDMHGIFYAMGPAFKQGYRTGTLWNIDIYPLICKILNIVPRQNIDGKLERIEFILK